MEQRTIGPFELVGQLGAGGMGIVYRAKYVKTGQFVALKLLPPGMEEDEKLIARFNRELEILKKLKHPNVVQCYGGGRLGNQRFYAMEIVEGGTLSQILRDRGKFSWERVIEYGTQICAALDHAHENGVVHRDLKPANLMLDKGGKIKLADFGLARLSDATALTAAGKTLGTFAYMAPEQISGNSPITAKTDLYALGVVLYELVTGRVPFQTETTAELLMQHLTKKPPRVCTEVLDCPIWLERVILQLMEKEPEKRPRDALAVQEALKEVAEKVAKNVSMAEHAVTGEPTNFHTETEIDTRDAKALLKRKRKKKKDQSPIWERTWFLGSGLALLILVVTYMLWPRSEEQLYTLAQPLMKSIELDEREEAKDKYLKELLRRFPDGKHAAEAKAFVEDVEADRFGEVLMAKIARNKDLKDEAERLFKKAYEYEQFGDRVTALEQYNSLNTIFKDQDRATPVRNLARRRAAELEKSGAQSAEERLKLVMDTLQKAEVLDQSGKPFDAMKIWDGIVSLYATNRELRPQVSYADARRAGKSSMEARPLLRGEKQEAQPVDPGLDPNQQPVPEGQQ